MKYAPKKVFILEDGKYKEITYSELQELEQSDKSYAEKFFLPLYGMLMEVTAETYKAYYKDTKEEEQLNSYATQCAWYTEKINANPEWEMVGIFADEGIIYGEQKLKI